MADDRTALELELRRARSNYQAAQSVGDEVGIGRWEDEISGIEADLANLGRQGPALQESVPVPQTAPMPNVSQGPPPAKSADVPRGTLTQQQDEKGPSALGRKDIRGALDALEEGDSPTASDYLKSAYSDLVRVGGSALLSMERNAREEQYRYLQALQMMEPEQGTEKHAQWEEAFTKAQRDVEAGDEVNPTFYGTFIRPFTEKDGKSAGQRVMERQEQILKSRSQQAQKLAEKPFAPTAEMFAKNFNAADPSTWFDGTAMPWEDWDAFALNMAQNVVSIGASLGAAVTGSRGGAMYKARQLRQEGTINPTIVRKQAAEFGEKTGRVAGMGTEYVLVRDAVSQQTEEALKKPELWDNADLWEKNADYQALIKAGYTSELAKQMLVNEAAGNAGVVAGMASVTIGAPLNKFLARLGLSQAVTRGGSALKAGTGEAVTEGLQESTEQIVQNAYERKFDPSAPITKDVVNAFFGGVAMGGGYGAITGFAAGGDSQAAFNADQKKLVKAGFDTWRTTANERSALQAKIRDPKYMTSTPAEQRLKDFLTLEELQYKEAKAFLKAEPVIRRMQAKYDSSAREKIRTDKLGARANAVISSIDRSRAARSDAETRAQTEAQLAAERDLLVKQIEDDHDRLSVAQQEKADLETIQTGGRLDNESRYASLIEKGYGRWTSNARSKFVLTPAGRAASESIGLVIQQAEEKLRSGYLGPERRKDLGRREKIGAMTPEQIEKEVFTSRITGIQNERAYQDDEAEAPAKAYASVDADSLKWINDNMGHSKGDELLKKVAKALSAQEGISVYHHGGDEFRVRGESPEQIEAAIRKAVGSLQSERIVDNNGRSVLPAVTWGVGKTFDEADANMSEWKRRREASGKRAARDAVPPSMREADEILTEDRQQRAPSRNESIDRRLAKLWVELMNKGDDFSRRRAARIQQQMLSNRPPEEANRFRRTFDPARTLKTDKDLKREFLGLTQEQQQVFERKAREFYQPYIGSYVTAMQAYLIENGSEKTQNDMLPSFELDTSGNPVDDIYSSAAAVHAAQILRAGAVPPVVTRALTIEQGKFSQIGLVRTMDEMLLERISDYFAALPMAGELDTSPLSPNTTAFDDLINQFKGGSGPLLMRMVDENSAYGFYSALKKGDKVEVMANGKIVTGAVMSADDTSIVVDLGAEQVFDHDTAGDNSVARFSTRWGWQISPRMARGGTGYHKQLGAWPGQARLGRIFNSELNAWESAKQVEKRKIKSINEKMKRTLPGLSSGSATRNEMRRAIEVANRLMSDFKNLPPIHIVNTVGDLPMSMQRRLLEHGSNGMGVIGMFDEIDPRNGVWIIAGNAASNISQGKIPYYGDTIEEVIAQGVIHEVIGHYGLRGFMGGDSRLDLWMDAIYRSFPEEVNRKGRGYGYARIVEGKTIFINEAARRLAAEEWLAETMQRLLVKGFVEPKQESLLRQILSYVKRWLVDRGYGRFVRLNNEDVMRLIYSAQNFAQNGTGWRFTTRTGVVKTTMMRDSEMFRSALEKTFTEGMRPTNSDERKQMKAKGLEPLSHVPLFPESASAQAYKEIFQKAVKDGKISSRELVFTGVEEFLDNLTYMDLANSFGVRFEQLDEKILPKQIREEYLAAERIASYSETGKAERIAEIKRQISEIESFGPDTSQISLLDKNALEATLDSILNSKPPSVDEIQEAIIKKEEIKRSKVGRKTRIPKSVISNFVHNKTLKISPVLKPTSSGGNRGYRFPDNWTREERNEAWGNGVDITPQNWNELRPSVGSAAFSQWVPIGTDTDSYLVYVIRQDRPNDQEFALRHQFGEPSKRGEFMHIRVATSGPDGKTYELLEMQSDVFQGLEHLPATDEARRSLQSIALLNKHRLSNVVRYITADTLRRMANEFDYEAKNSVAGIDPDTDPVRYKEAVENTAIEFLKELSPTNDALIEEVDNLAGVSEDDARYNEIRDLQAVSETLRAFTRAVSKVVSRIAGMEPDHLARTVRDSYEHLWAEHSDSFSSSPAAQRVFANRHLANRLMGIIGNAMSVQFRQNIKSLLDEAAVTAEVVHATIDVRDVSDEIRAALVEACYYAGQLAIQEASPGIFLVTASRSYFADSDSLVASLKDGISRKTFDRLKSQWVEREEFRVERVRQVINALTTGRVENINNQDLLTEIDYQEVDASDLQAPMDELVQEFVSKTLRSWGMSRDIEVFAEMVEARMSGFLTDDDGRLNEGHPEYVRIAATGNPEDDFDRYDAQEQAETWLANARYAAALIETQPGGEVFEQLQVSFLDDLENRGGYVASRHTFRIPISWDENGEPDEFMSGELINNRYSPDEFSIIDHDYHLIIDSPNLFHSGTFSLEEDAVDNLKATIAEYYESENITPNVRSVFYVDPSDVLRVEALRKELAAARPTPDFSSIISKVVDSIERSEGDGKVDLSKVWEAGVRASRIQNTGINSPLIAAWKNIGAKFLIADAVRKGADKIQWQSAEAGTKRGGWQQTLEWVSVGALGWERMAFNTGGKEEHVYRLTTKSHQSGAGLMVAASRMPSVIGIAAWRAIQNQEKRAQSGEVVPDISSGRYLVKKLDISHGRSTHGVFDLLGSNGPDYILYAGSEREMDVRRSELIEDLRIHKQNDVISSGIITNQELGGSINIALSKGIGDVYSDDPPPSTGHIRGARVNYEVILPSVLNKLAEPFGGKVTESVKQTDQYTLISAEESGLRVKRPDTMFDKEFPNARIIGSEEGHYYLAHSGDPDRSIDGGVKHDTYEDAEKALADAVNSFNAGKEMGIVVYELKITDEMREFFGQGELPILMKGEAIESSREGYPPLLMATDVPSMMMVDMLKGNPILQAAAKKIGVSRRKPPLRQRIEDFFKNLSERVDQGLFDQFAGIRHSLEKTGASSDPYMAARLSTSHDAQMRAVLSFGHPVWRNGVMQTEGKGLLEILAPVSDPDTLRAWSLYMATTRAGRLMAEGRERLFTDEEIREGRRLGIQNPIFQQVAQEYAEFNKKVLDFAEQAGVIDPQTRPLWEHADYVPFYRVKDDRLAGPLHPSAGIAGQRSQIKTLKGGTEGIADIPANIVLNISSLIDSAVKNNAAKMVVDALNGTGLMVKIPSVQFSQKLVPMEQVKQKLVAAGMNPKLIPQGALEGMQKMFIADPPGGEGVISIMRNGKREFYRSDDMLLWQSMMMVNPKQFGAWMNIFRGPKRFLTTAITLDPGFMVRNFLRDMLSSFVVSRDNYEPVHRALAGLGQALVESKTMRAMVSAGASFDSGYINAIDPEATGRAIRKAMRSRGFKVSVLDTPAKLFDAYKALGSAIENANRVAVYNAAKASGKSDLQAAYEAKDLMDFSRHGSWPVVKFLMQSVPFMNARLQGLSRLSRGFVENPISFTIKGVLVGLAGAALWLAFRDDERYKELEDWDKDTYFHFWVGDKHYRLPKPFEVGVIFNTVPERIMEFWWSQEPDAGKLLLQRFGHAITETFSMNPIPQTAAPFVEMYFNKNFFTQRQIVSPFEEDRLPPEQLRPFTSPTMVELARSLPAWMDDVSPKFRSPLYLENLYSGYMGTLGNYMLQAADEVVRASMDYPARPERQPADLPVIGSFYRGTSEDVRRVRYEEGFYDLVRKVTQVKGSLSFLERVGMESRLDLVDKKYEPYVAIAKDVQIARRDIARLNEASMKVWIDPDMDPAAKRAELNEIQKEKNEIYREVFNLRPGTRENPITQEDLDFLLSEFGKSPDRLVRRLEAGRAPVTADLVRDVLATNNSLFPHAAN